jgi:type IV pilus assembly protein PilE
MAHRLNPGRARGFTLIELMVAVVIVGVLSAIAYPSYTDSVRKSKRASAKAKMTEVAGRLSQYYSAPAADTSATYTLLFTDLAYPAGALYSDAKGHTLTLSAGASGIASSYLITATPVTADPTCGNLTLDNLGTFLPAGC